MVRVARARGHATRALEYLNDRVARIMQTRDMKRRMADDGLVAAGGTREQFATHIRTEIAKWAKVIELSGARVD